MKRAVRQRLQRILDSSTSETDSSTPDHSFSCPLDVFNSPRIKHFDTCKEDLHDDSSSASAFEVGSRSQDEESVLVRERRDGYLKRMVSDILTDSSSLSEEDGGSLDGGETYIPRWLRQRTNSASKDEEESTYKDVSNTTSSRLLSVSEELQTLSKKLKKGAGSEQSSSSNISASRKQDLKRKYCTTIHDCKRRLEYLISKLEGLDAEARPLHDSSIEVGVLPGEKKNDEAADTAAFGSLLRTEPVTGDVGENKDSSSGETQTKAVDLRQEITYQQSPSPEAVVESVHRPQLPPVDVEGNPLEAKNGESSEVKPRVKSRPRTRRKKHKTSSTKRRTFKGMVETKVLPRVRVARAMAEIPKAKLTKPTILARKTKSSDDQRIVNSNNNESTLPLLSTPNKTTEEITTSKKEPKDTGLKSPDIAESANSKPGIILKKVENKGNRKEGNSPNEPIRLGRDVGPSFPGTHRQRKPTGDGAETHSTNRPLTKQTRNPSFRTPSMEKSSTKSQSRANESTRKQTRSKRNPSRNNSTARSGHKTKEPQCLDLLLSDNDLQDPEPTSETRTSPKPSSAKKFKLSSPQAETTSKDPNLSKEGAKKSPKRLSSLLRIALRRNDSMDTGDMFRKRNSIGKGRTAILKESRLGETWRKTKNAFDSMWEKNSNQAHTASALFSFFRSPKATKPQRPWRFTV